jgi:hypothetical protein
MFDFLKTKPENSKRRTAANGKSILVRRINVRFDGNFTSDPKDIIRSEKYRSDKELAKDLMNA